MALSDKPNLKPYNDYDEKDVINGLFAAETVPMNKGTFVTITASYGNNNVYLTGSGVTASPALATVTSANGAPSYATSLQYGLVGKVAAANSGQVVLGMTLSDTKEFNNYGERFRFGPQDYKDEREVVVSGQSVRIVTKGRHKLNSFIGTPSFNTGAYASGGYLIPCPYNKTLFPQLVGKFLTGADADGYALFQIELA